METSPSCEPKEYFLGVVNCVQCRFLSLIHATYWNISSVLLCKFWCRLYCYPQDCVIWVIFGEVGEVLARGALKWVSLELSYRLAVTSAAALDVFEMAVPHRRTFLGFPFVIQRQCVRFVAFVPLQSTGPLTFNWSIVVAIILSQLALNTFFVQLRQWFVKQVRLVVCVGEGS